MAEENEDAKVLKAVKNHDVKFFEEWSPKRGKDQHLIFDENGLTPLHLAAKNGDFDILKLILNHTTVVDVLSKTDRTTPLIHAAHSGHLKIVKYLVEEKMAKVSHVDITSHNAFYYARTYGNFDVAEYLAKKEEPDAWTSFSRYLGSVFSSSNVGNANIGDSPAKGGGYKYITENN